MNDIKRWIDENAQHLLHDYSLNSRSVVFDVGGFMGQWSFDLLQKKHGVCGSCGAKQDPYVHIFEPVFDFYNSCRERFRDYEKVTVHNFGLSNRTYQGSIVRDEAASCLSGPCPWRKPGEKPSENVAVRDIDSVMGELGVQKIDLMSVNIEGEEYDLVKRMIETNIISRVENLQVQFHDFIPDAEEKRIYLQGQLYETHKLNWQYPFVWESWSLK